MTKPGTSFPPRRAARAWLLAVVALVALAALPAPVAGASAVQLEARALVGGRYAVNGWLAVSVTLVNPGEPTEGHLLVTTDAGTVRRFVEMPAGARKAVTLYVQPEPFQRRIEVRYDEPNGTAATAADIRVLEASSRQVAIVGDGAGTLRPQLATGVDGSLPEPIALDPADIPERPEPLSGIDAIVWAGDSASLTEGQRRSLERWVAEGGQLVVIGGPDWQTRTGGFTDLLPLESLEARDGVPQSPLATWTGTDAPAAETDTVSTGDLRDGARSVLAAEDGTILASMRSEGAGRVVLVGMDLAADPYRGWEGSPRLWGRILPSGAALAGWFGFPMEEDLRQSINQALGSLPALAVPPAELLLAVIVGYILLIGPVSYVVLRRFDRREAAWVTAPVLVLVFTAGSYGIGAAAKGGDVTINQISIVRSTPAGSSATVETYAGIFSPSRATYDLSVDADALIGRIRPAGMQVDASDSVADQGRPSTLRSLAVGVFSFEGVSAVGQVDHRASLAVTWRTDGDDLVGTVTNLADHALEDVAYISQSQGEMVGDLGPGESAEFRIGRTNLNGSWASEQVYGFGGFESQSDEQRREFVRRQVIDSLVGYGGFAPGMDVASIAGRGPYVIGWLEGEGPMPVTVEDVEALRSAVTVEVVSVRPMALSGAVTISPAQMSVEVIETEGNATVMGPGMASVSNGSATISINLPLDAAGMQVTELEILAGPDPSMVLGEQGGFGGFWPVGTMIELWDPGTGEWSLLGDLADRSRFEIPDPAAAIGSTGTMTVRVSGPEANPNFGDAPVFVSARASGVLEP